MANDRITISTAQLLALFPDEETARHYIESRREGHAHIGVNPHVKVIAA